MAIRREDLEKHDKSELIDFIVSLSTQLEEYRNQNLEQRKTISRLEKVVAAQNKEIKGLKSRIAQLEKNSSNSSKPPSSDMNRPKKRIFSLRKKSGKKPGGQLGHKGVGRSLVESPDEVIRCEPELCCGGCGTPLDFKLSKITSRRQEIEIPPVQPIITEYQEIENTCRCGTINIGKYPDHIKTNIQFGSRIKGLMVYLNVRQLIPYKRLQEMSSDLFGLDIAKASIENMLESATVKSGPIVESILQGLKKGKWVGSDETSKKVGVKKYWEWVWMNAKASYYAIDPSRGYKVVQEYFGETYEGVLVHDCYSAQNNTIAKSGHQLCHAHLHRDLKFLIEIHRSQWAYELDQFLRSAQRARDRIWTEGVDECIRKKVIKDYNQRFSEFRLKPTRNPECTKLWKRMKKHSDKILLFMSDPDIPWHNNGSEQAIRMVKVKQKISGCFRSERGAQRHSTLCSVIETAKKQGMKPLSAIEALFNGSLVFSF